MTIIIIRESAKMAFDTIRKNKLRSMLTILGVTVGVVTILAMVSIIQGLNRSFSEQIESLGSNTIFIAKFDPSFGKPPGQEERQRKELTIEDANALRDGVSTAVGVSPFQREIASTIRYREKQTDTAILVGVTPYYEFTQSQYISYGRFIIDADLNDRSNEIGRAHV